MKDNITTEIIEKVRGFGADLCGITSVELLKKSPANVNGLAYGARMFSDAISPLGLKPGEIFWPEDAKSVIVFAVSHPESKPEMDWWFGDVNPSGNRLLINIAKDLKGWLPERFPGSTVHSVTYSTEAGGIFLKDAAVLAGLGCIGKNNLLVTPEYGPRVRCRAVLVSEALPVTVPVRFDPCEECVMPCRAACPVDAFGFTSGEVTWPACSLPSDIRPAGDGSFNKLRCDMEMDRNIADAKPLQVDIPDDAIDHDANGDIGYVGAGRQEVMVYKYCRSCEFACIAGTSGR
ncbi:MAG: hypothetical protein LBN35_00250 [Clostridiales Family XIII bacterium]|jgi:epoxyqueuosine reductase|nr:hypothetical protein [Clostridiales Family XIII bacterium]